MKILKKIMEILLISFMFIYISFTFSYKDSQAYPIYAQQAYANPRAANGRLACANCHLAEKPIQIESPKAILPNKVFEAAVKIPYPKEAKQILGNGQLSGLNVGAVVILPEGFKLAPSNLISKEIQEKNKGVYISPYSSNQDNILVVGPISGDLHKEINFPILSPDPATNKKVNFLKYPIYIGANRGRGQIYPTGEKSNNNIVTSSFEGAITEIQALDKGDTLITIVNSNGQELKQTIPKGLSLIVSKKDNIKLDQPLTKDPNVGGFGQTDIEIVLQDPNRVIGFIVFAFSVLFTQIVFVIKKKQFEKVQAAELKF
uniref:Cytochrome f n=3 Tax=Sargassum TaxID=3015 RepID=A0A8K1RT77_9PHAE|nr:cytochrome f [Sargassum confusum]QXI87529.1 PetA [Sargassum muticum]UEP18023.1 PetA [Sargassum kjellmanianum]UVW81567.1 cytochrome f [Sargassum siliquastrum]AZJ16024.1 cytochrome f [Sargassum confusum]UVF63205.1 cytochrome f [Sargassum confusum]